MIIQYNTTHDFNQIQAININSYCTNYLAKNVFARLSKGLLSGALS